MINLFELPPNATLRPRGGPTDERVEDMLCISQGGRMAFWYALQPSLAHVERPEHITEGLA